ncbi:MAG: hypothetical protein ACRDYV_20630, partial [Acidimicrobiia bacterium]
MSRIGTEHAWGRHDHAPAGPPAHDRCEIVFIAPGGAIRRTSDRSCGLDRYEITVCALAGAIPGISDRSKGADLH